MFATGRIPLNEAQTYPLTKLNSQEQELVWGYAVDTAKAEGREVTTEDVKKAVRLTGGNTEPEAEKKSNKHCMSDLEQIDTVGPEFKKAYELLFAVIKKSMNNKWETTSKEVIICRLEGLVKFLKLQRGYK